MNEKQLIKLIEEMLFKNYQTTIHIYEDIESAEEYNEERRLV